MHVAARARLVLARRPWIYWVVVAAFATFAAVGVHGALASIDAERERWGSSRTVLVATTALEPGDELVAEAVELPVAAVPADALTSEPAAAVVRQRVAEGAVLTGVDITSGPGPAALAQPGTVVVAVSDPLARDIVVGLDVRIVADGLVVADIAQVTGIVEDVIFVAVAAEDGPVVAAAAQQGLATLLYLP